jgi:hypothetical protein
MRSVDEYDAFGELFLLAEGEDMACPSRWGLWRAGAVNLLGSHHFFCSRSSPSSSCGSMLDQAKDEAYGHRHLGRLCDGASGQGMHCTRCPCTDSCSGRPRTEY